MEVIEEKDEKRAFFESPADTTSKGVRSRLAFAPEVLWGVERPRNFLRRALLEGHRKCLDPILFTTVQTVMLYGRKGSGKNTLLHSRINGDRYEFFDEFDVVRDWKMRPWNHSSFLAWAEETIYRMQKIIEHLSRRKELFRQEQEHKYSEHAHLVSVGFGKAAAGAVGKAESILIVIQNVHLIHQLRDPVYINTLLRLLTTVRICSSLEKDAIRVVMTCADVPSILSPEIRTLVDQECYMGLPSPVDCREMILDWMRRFQSLASTSNHFKHLTWSIELDQNAVDDDPDHIVNLLTLASQGTTPREIYDFLVRVNDACSRPNEDGSTDYNEDLLQMLLYSPEGVGKSIVPYNPETENSAINKFLGIDYASASSSFSAKRGNDDNLLVVAPIIKPDPLDQPILHNEEEEDGQDKSAKKKQRREDGGGEGGVRDMHAILAERAAARETTLRSAAKREEETKKRSRNQDK